MLNEKIKSTRFDFTFASQNLGRTAKVRHLLTKTNRIAIQGVLVM